MVIVSQSMMVVIMCVSCQLCTLFIFTKLYQEEAPYQNHHGIRVRRRLPNITGSHARGAKPIGVFGMVYQRLPHGRSGSTAILLCYYHHLPSASIKPKHPGRLGQYRAQLWARGHCHTSIPAPWSWHNVATPHAVATIHPGGRTGPPHPNHIINGVRCIFSHQSNPFW